jgi:hypothetical protein
MTTDGQATSAFPRWVILGGILLALGYLPMISAPFDFMDDGNLVYPTKGLTLPQHAELWWQKVAANVEHLGPFRPAVWLHWQTAANLFGADSVAWRSGRLVWCAFAAITLLWFFHTLKIPPVAAMLAGAAAMWNPYRNEIWTSLTLAEGVAMPYAMLALIASRRAVASPRPMLWDWLAMLSLLMCLGCKNTFVALLPVMLYLRVANETGCGVWDGLKANWWRVLVYTTPLAMPVIHFIYFKTHWKPGYYETPGPSFTQAGHFLNWLKGASGVDFLAAGALAAVAMVWWKRKSLSGSIRVPLVAGAGLLICGFAVYLPMNIMSSRYTMPAVWGVDLLFALLLSAFVKLESSRFTQVTWAALGLGLVALMVAGVNRQEKIVARNTMLWSMIHHVEKQLPTGAVLEWRSGSTESGELNVEEGIHFYWHLLHRGRGDVRILLTDLEGNPIPRVELAPVLGEPAYRLSAHGSDETLAWKLVANEQRPYRYGAKRHDVVLETRRAVPKPEELDELTKEMIRRSLTGGFDPKKKLVDGPVFTGMVEAKKKP